MRYSVLCRIHYRYLIVGIYYCYIYLLVHCVQNGPVHPLLEFPPPKDPIPIPLPINIGLYSVIDTYLQTVYRRGLYIHYQNFASQRSHPHTTTNKHRIIPCYIYLLVDCVEKGPVHPLPNFHSPEIPCPYHYQKTWD